MIGLSYVGISASLVYFYARTRQNIPFQWVFPAFGLFIIACGFYHFMHSALFLGIPVILPAAGVQAITLVASLATAVVLPPLVPRALAVVEAAKLSLQRKVELEAAHSELESLYSRLKELDDLKTQFFANVSHEFRTPLTLMLGPIRDMLEDENNLLSPQQRERVEIAHRNSLRLLKLVNSLLDFSRIEEGRMQAIYEPTDLGSLTSELASAFRSLIERGGLRLVVDCPKLSEPVYVDREKWEKVIFNLLSNAFKFTSHGKIKVALQEEDRHAVLTVRDTGVGIPEREIPHLFERFYRVESPLGRSYEGSGIGLALVKELVSMHGGTITVASRLGVGTTFTVRLPLGASHLPKEQIGAVHQLSSTAVGSEAYIEEARRWLPEEASGPEDEPEAPQERKNRAGQVDRPRFSWQTTTQTCVTISVSC
jgi:signal transduction histidine kinase